MNDLDERLRAADPASHVGSYDDATILRMLDDITLNAVAPPRESLVRALSRRRWAVVAAAAGLTGILTLTPVGLRIISDDPLGRDGTRRVVVGAAGAAAEASELLHRAATITPTDPQARPGQFWKITRTARESRSESRAVTGAPGGFDTATYMVTNTYEQYLPVDGQGTEWIVESSDDNPTHVAGPRDWFTPTPTKDVYSRTPDLTQRQGSWLHPSVAFFAAMPTDTAKLRDRLYSWDGENDPYLPPEKQNGGPDTYDADGYAFSKAANILSDGRAPARLRAATLEVLRTIPGVRITDRRAPIGTRVGVAIGRDLSGNGEYRQIVIDPQNGVVLGERYIAGLNTTGRGLKEGTVRSAATFTRTLVDDVPTAIRRAAMSATH